MLNCVNLTVGYTVPIIENLNLEIKTNDYLLIVGKNGSGKSTLVKTILGLQKPLGGSVKLHGIQKSEIGYVAQLNEVKQDFPATVYEIVLSGMLNQIKYRPFLKKREKEKALELMKEMDILDLKEKAFKDLSGGQRQRVYIVRALLASCKILILDEPTTGLDFESANKLYNLIKKINNKVALVVITHEPEKLKNDAKHILEIGTEIRYTEIARGGRI